MTTPTYVSKGQRSLLAVTEFDGKVDIQGTKKVIAALKGHPELEYSLHKLFEVLNEALDKDILLLGQWARVGQNVEG